MYRYFCITANTAKSRTGYLAQFNKKNTAKYVRKQFPPDTLRPFLLDFVCARRRGRRDHRRDLRGNLADALAAVAHKPYDDADDESDAHNDDADDPPISPVGSLSDRRLPKGAPPFLGFGGSAFAFSRRGRLRFFMGEKTLYEILRLVEVEVVH